MHRNLCVPRGGTLMFLLALLACAAPGTASAQEQVPPPSPVTPVIVPLNGTVSLQMSTKKLIKSVDEEDKGAKIVSVQPLKRDPTTVLVTGLSPGIARIALTDVDNTKEMFEIIVQTDVQYLKYIIRRAVPAANIDIVPSANNVFILTGHVQRSEDVQIVVDAARSVVGDRIINALRVGGVMQVQLCTTIARVARSEARSMGFSFLHTGQRGFLASILSSPLNLTVAE